VAAEELVAEKEKETYVKEAAAEMEPDTELLRETLPEEEAVTCREPECEGEPLGDPESAAALPDTDRVADAEALWQPLPELDAAGRLLAALVAEVQLLGELPTELLLLAAALREKLLLEQALPLRVLQADVREEMLPEAQRELLGLAVPAHPEALRELLAELLPLAERHCVLLCAAEAEPEGLPLMLAVLQGDCVPSCRVLLTHWLPEADALTCMPVPEMHAEAERLTEPPVLTEPELLPQGLASWLAEARAEGEEQGLAVAHALLLLLAPEELEPELLPVTEAVPLLLRDAWAEPEPLRVPDWERLTETEPVAEMLLLGLTLGLELSAKLAELAPEALELAEPLVVPEARTETDAVGHLLPLPVAEAEEEALPEAQLEAELLPQALEALEAKADLLPEADPALLRGDTDALVLGDLENVGLEEPDTVAQPEEETVGLPVLQLLAVLLTEAAPEAQAETVLQALAEKEPLLLLVRDSPGDLLAQAEGLMVELTLREAELQEESLAELVPELQADMLELPQELLEAAEL
jgi:hypothetical protein